MYQDPSLQPQGQAGPYYQQQQPLHGQQQPMYGQPMQQQPMYAQPMQQQPMYAQPMQQQPMYAQPVQHQPAVYAQPQPQPMAGVDWTKESVGGRFNYDAPQAKAQDVFWAVLFVAHLLVIVAMALKYGPDAAKALRDDTEGGSGTLGKHGGKIILFLVGTAAVGAVFAAIYLQLVQKYVKQIVTISVGINVVFMALFAFVFLINASVVGFIIMLVFMALTLLWFYLVRRRIPLAQALIGASARAVQDHSGSIWVAYIMVAVEILWISLWAFATVSIYWALDPKGEEEAGNNRNNLLYFLLLVSLYWTAAVCQNVSHVTTAGTVGSWWFQPGQPSPTWNAFKRATTTSFGSICLGSLIVAVLQALREMARAARQDARRERDAAMAILACFLECILGCLESLVRFFNTYAFSMVALYGQSFTSSARATWHMFQSRGMEVLINDDISGFVLGLGCLGAGACSGALGMVWAAGTGMGAWWVFGIVGFLLGYIVCALVMSVLHSAVATTYVCWAEDPQALAEGRPAEYDQIRNASLALHPNLRF